MPELVSNESKLGSLPLLDFRQVLPVHGQHYGVCGVAGVEEDVGASGARGEVGGGDVAGDGGILAGAGRREGEGEDEEDGGG